MHYDSLLIGGGVIGLSIAYELSRHGERVAVLDGAEPGRGASWAGAGIFPPAIADTAHDPLEQLRGISHRLHAEWAAALQEETGIDNGYRRCGGIHVARRPGEAAALRAAMDEMAAEEIEIEPLDAAALVAREPALAACVARTPPRCAYYLPDEAQLRNPWHLRALRAACERRGVLLLGNTPVESLATRGNRVVAAVTPQGNFTAERFCIAGGAWSSLLARQLGVELGIEPIRGQMLLYKLEAAPLRHVYDEGPQYIVPRDDGHLLVGSTMEEAGFDLRTTAEGLGELKRFAEEILPPLANVAPAQSWAGLRPASRDGWPILDRLPGLSNAFAATGHFRHGLHLSPGTAVVMRCLMRGEEPPMNVQAFCAQR